MADSTQNEKTVFSISFLKKRPDITHEQFYSHWENVHGPLVKPWMEKHGFVSYTQVHSTPDIKSASKPMGPETKSHNVLQDYDGAAVIEAKSQDVFTAAFADEYYQTVIAEDEKHFLDKSAGVLRMRGDSRKILKAL